MRLIYIIFLIVIFASCKKDNTTITPNYPKEPQIQFTNLYFDKKLDLLGNEIIVANFNLEYSDGDANLGDMKSYEEYYEGYYNCEIIRYKKENGSFKLIDTTKYHLPQIKNNIIHLDKIIIIPFRNCY
jgi:hypothetical protein